MAAPSAQTLQRPAYDTGHQPGTLEKVMRLLDLLQETAHTLEHEIAVDDERGQLFDPAPIPVTFAPVA